MPTRLVLAASVAVAACLVSGCKSNNDEVKLTRSKGEPAPHGDPRPNAGVSKVPIPLAMNLLDTTKLPKLSVKSSTFGSEKPIPPTYADYGEKSSPPLKIGNVPTSAKSIVIICDDPDAIDPKPFVHWVLYNLPPSITEIRTAVPGTGQVRQLMNAKQGVNSHGSTGYFGPHPPAGDPPHHYHFQVFALDQMLPLEQASTKSDVIAAAKGHVVAAGELVGTFAKPNEKPKS